MKKRLLVTLILFMMVFVASCGNGGSKTEEESAASGESTEAASTEGSSGGMLESKEAGMAIKMPPTYLENKDKVYLYYSGSEAEEGLYILEAYLYPASEEALMTMGDEEYNTAESQSINPLTLFRVTSDWDKEKLDQWIEWLVDMDTAQVKELTKDGDYTVYYYEESEYSEDLPEELKPIYEGIIQEIQAEKENVVYSEPVDPALVNAGAKISFNSEDLEGNPVSSEEIFGKNQYTMVNFWASWCGPCIQEMPELEKLNKELEEQGCGIIGVLIDAKQGTGLEDGLSVVADTGVTYTNVQGWDTLNQEFNIQFVPTTMFVDAEGNVVGETVVSADFDKYREIMDSLLNK